MIENLLLVMCITHPGQPCEKMGQAYYQYSGLDKWADHFAKTHEELVYTLGTMTVIQNRQVAFPLVRGVVISVVGPKRSDDRGDNYNIRWELGY